MPDLWEIRIVRQQSLFQPNTTESQVSLLSAMAETNSRDEVQATAADELAIFLAAFKDITPATLEQLKGEGVIQFPHLRLP